MLLWSVTMSDNDYGLNPRPQAEADTSSWLVSFSDLVTILMVFFVILISPTDYSALRFERSLESFRGRSDESQPSLQQTFAELKQAVAANAGLLSAGTEVAENGKDITITFSDSMLFDSGKALLKQESRRDLDALVAALQKLPTYARIAIEGYTDDNPIHTSDVQSNWHLSTLRALSVLSFLEGHGLCTKNCELRGFGQTRPYLPNRDTEGHTIAANQAKNRRVVVRIF